MYRTLTLAAAAALAMGASFAYGEEVTGTVQNIDLTGNTFEVEGTLFTASPQNTVGPDLSELKEGDKVTVSYEQSGATPPPYNAMAITQDDQ
jgi:hypothetical protein